MIEDRKISVEHREDFISIYEDVFPDDFCEKLIQQFELCDEKLLVIPRKELESNIKTYEKNDSCLFLNLSKITLDPYIDSNGEEHIIQNILKLGLESCLRDYTDTYDILSRHDLMSCDLKMQKTKPGQGYHVWHMERNGRDTSLSSRVLAWILYCNTIDDAGETEFLYQKTRINPKKNRLMIWPSGFTHAHRGNVVHGKKSKYIVTGWILFK